MSTAESMLLDVLTAVQTAPTPTNWVTITRQPAGTWRVKLDVAGIPYEVVGEDLTEALELLANSQKSWGQYSKDDLLPPVYERDLAEHDELADAQTLANLLQVTSTASTLPLSFPERAALHNRARHLLGLSDLEY